MIEKGQSYRPIDGSVVGLVEEVVDRAVHWRHKETVFLIPLERFTEYFELIKIDKDEHDRPQED